MLKKPAILAVLVGLLCFFGFSRYVSAGTGTLYLESSAATVTKGSDVAVQVRVDPGTAINYVALQVSYDASKLQFVSHSADGTAFENIVEENVTTNPITSSRWTANTTASNSLIITLKFKALAGSGSTAISIAGNTALNGPPPFDPATQGVNINFTSNSPAGSGNNSQSQSPATSNQPGGQSNSSNQQSSNGSTSQPQTEQGYGRDAIESFGQFTDQTQRKPINKLWFIAIGLITLLVTALYIRKRQAQNAEEIVNTPIDTSWAKPAAEQHHAEVKDELLNHVPGEQNPNPGSIVTPVDKKDEQ